MAYNPFDFFRRNQKILFALITIMVMFMFVLSSGVGGRGADFFQWFPEWLGSKRGTGGETVATLAGKPLTTGSLGTLERQRNLVNDFMNALADRSRGRLAKSLSESVTGADRESGQGPINQFLQSRASGYKSFQMQMQEFQMMQRGQRMDPRQLQVDMINEMGRLQQTLKSISTNPNSKPEDLRLANAAENLIELDAKSMNRTFFTTVENRSRDQQLEFELWKRKADKLGITITPSEAEKMALSEVAGVASEAEFKELLREIQQRDPQLTSEKFRAYLADEFRVRLAQQAVIGQTFAREPELVADQSVGSPYEQYLFYKQQTAEAKFGFIRVPVDNYIDQVTGEPSAQEYQDLFAKYRTREPSPVDEKPGFKEPRKLKLEYLAAKGDEPFYKKAAAELQPKTELLGRLSALMTSPIGPAGVVPVVTGGGLLNLRTEDVLATAYDQYKTMANANINSNWSLNFFNDRRADVTDETFVKPTHLAALTATQAGSLMGFSTAWTAPFVLLERARLDDRNARARAQAGLFLVPIPGSVAPLAGTILTANLMPQPLPLAVLKPGTEQKLRDQLAETIARNDLQKFRDELAKLGKSIDKGAARSYLEGFIKERALKTGASSEFRDMFAIDSDPGLSFLREKFLAFAKTMRGRDAIEGVDAFGPAFFGRTDPKEGVFYTPVPINAFRTTAEDPDVIVWRTAEIPAEEPKDPNDPKVKAKIIAAWKRIKAGEIAKAKAEAIAKEIPTYGTTMESISPKMIDLGAKMKVEFPGKVAANKARYFEIDRVAPLRVESTFNFNRAPASAFQLQESDDIPYPTNDIQKELFETRDKSVGTTFVVPDMPKTSYYVGVLLNKDVRGTLEFAETVYKPSLMNIPGGRNDLSETVRNGFTFDARSKARKNAVALLKAEFQVEKENEKLLASKGDE